MLGGHTYKDLQVKLPALASKGCDAMWQHARFYAVASQGQTHSSARIVPEYKAMCNLRPLPILIWVKGRSNTDSQQQPPARHQHPHPKDARQRSFQRHIVLELKLKASAYSLPVEEYNSSNKGIRRSSFGVCQQYYTTAAVDSTARQIYSSYTEA